MSNRAGAKDEGVITSSAIPKEMNKKAKKPLKAKSNERKPVHAILYVPKGAEPVDEMTIQVVSINEASFASIAMRRT
jgi:hypothetical protein